MRRLLSILLILASFGANAQFVEAILYKPAATVVNPYTHSYSLTIDHTQMGSGTTATYTATINTSNISGISATYLKDVAHGGAVQNSTTFNGQTVPADVVFSRFSDFRSLLNWDVQSWDNVNGILVAHVADGTATNISDSILYMGIGSASTTTYQGGSVGAALASFYIVYLHLQNATTLSALSATGSNNGTITGATATAGTVDGAASFNGSNQSIRITSTTGQTNAFTVEAWIYPTSFSSVGTITANYSALGGAQFRVETNGTLGVVNECIAGIANSTGTVALNTWSHVAFTWNGSTTYAFYINGSVSGSGTVGSTTFALNDMVIGYNQCNNSEYFTGKIDELKKTTNVLTADRILADYNIEKSGSTAITAALVY